MRIFATVGSPEAFPVDASGSSKGVYGANIGANTFITNLIRHGSFDEFHFFLHSRISAQIQTEQEHFIRSLGALDKIKIFNLSDIESILNEQNYVVIHNPGGPYMVPALITLRNLYTNGLIPVTGVTHTISYQSMFSHFLELILTDIRPWDSLIYPVPSTQKVIKKILDLLINRLKIDFGLDIIYQGRLDEIPFGVDTTLYCPRNKQDMRKQLDIPMNKTIILWVGRFSHYDKMDLRPLLLAFRDAIVRISNKTAPLLILAGDDRYNYSSKLQEFARQIGIQEFVDIRTDFPLIAFPYLYSAADIYVSPCDNIQETFGLTIIEAMASGLPIIASDWNGYHSTVPHGEVGFRIPTYWAECDTTLCDLAAISPWLSDHLYLGESVCVDVEKLSEYLALLLENEDLRRIFGENSRRHVTETYSWSVIIKKYEALWQELNDIVFSNHAAINKKRRPKNWLFRPDYFDVFQHYATRILSDDTHFLRTNYGKFLMDQPDQIPWYEELDFILSRDVVNKVLNVVDDEVSIDEITKRLSKSTKTLSREKLRYILMFLLKYNILKLADN